MASLQPSPSPIASRTKTCVELFKRLNELSREPDGQQDATAPTTEAADALGRFRIWAGNIGAFQKFESKSSLDYRLRDAKKIAIQIVGLLDDLAESLEDASAIASNERANRTSSTLEVGPAQADDGNDEGLEDGEELSEITEIFSSIIETINSLFRFSIIIRNNTNRDRYAKATIASRGDPIQDHFDIQHVREKFPALEAKGKEWLINRLGKAITQRRQYLKYCREHHQKTSVDLITPKLESLQKDAEVTPMQGATKAHTVSGMSALSKPPSTLAQTQASTLILNSSQNVEEEVPEDSQSQTSYATSNEEDSSSSVLHVVQLEDVSKGLDHFECPYCWQILAITTQRAWKKHALSDVKPYVCTYEDCDVKLFSDRHTWFSHELRDHRREWSCRFCARPPFDSIAKYQEHLNKRHPQSFIQDQLPALLEMSQTPLVKVSPSDCPFCDDWEQRLRSVNPDIPLSDTLVVTQVQFMHHLGAHMEQLALFAIPRGYTEVGDADSANAAPGSDLSLPSSDGDSPLSAKVAAAQLESCKISLLNLVASISSSTSEHAFVTPYATGSLAELRRNISGPFVDLSDISQGLTNGRYSTAREVKEDIDKMFAEFYFVTAEGSPEYLQIKDFRTRFEKLWSDIHDENSPSIQAKEADSDGEDSFYWEEESGEDRLRIPGTTTNEDGPEVVTSRLEQMRKQVLTKEFWMADELVFKCFRCGDAFSGFRRKHHCRTCGNIFDSKCTAIISGDKFDMQGSLKVCKTCSDTVNGGHDSNLFENVSDRDLAPEITLREQWRLWRAKRLYLVFQNEASYLGQLRMPAITICFKTPQVVERTFLPTHELEEMYAYVECLDILDVADDDWALEDVHEPAGYHHEYQFALLDEESGDVYYLASGGTIGDRVGPNRTLLVQNKSHTGPVTVPVGESLEILICEESHGSLKYLEKQLHDLEHRPTRIYRNELRLDKVATAAKFDIIFAEVSFARQEALDLRRNIHNFANVNQETPIVAVTKSRSDFLMYGGFDAVLGKSSQAPLVSEIISQSYTAPRTFATALVAAQLQSQGDLMSLAFDHLKSTIDWWSSPEQFSSLDPISMVLDRRVQTLLSLLTSVYLRSLVRTAQMHIQHEVLHYRYFNEKTMSGELVAEIPRDRFLATEDNYAWDMEELSAAIDANRALRSPITRRHFTPNDLGAILNHPLGAHLKTLFDEDGGLLRTDDDSEDGKAATEREHATTELSDEGKEEARKLPEAEKEIASPGILDASIIMGATSDPNDATRPSATATRRKLRGLLTKSGTFGDAKTSEDTTLLAEFGTGPHPAAADSSAERQPFHDLNQGYSPSPPSSSRRTIESEMNQYVPPHTDSSPSEKKLGGEYLKVPPLQGVAGLQPLHPEEATSARLERSEPGGPSDTESNATSSHLHTMPVEKTEQERRRSRNTTATDSQPAVKMVTNPYRSSEQEYYIVPASTRKRDHRTTYSSTVDNADIRNRERDRRHADRPLRYLGTVADDYGEDGYGYTNPKDLVQYDLNLPVPRMARNFPVYAGSERTPAPRRSSFTGYEDPNSKAASLQNYSYDPQRRRPVVVDSRKPTTITTAYRIRDEKDTAVRNLPESAQRGRTTAAQFNPADTMDLRTLKEALNKTEASAQQTSTRRGYDHDRSSSDDRRARSRSRSRARDVAGEAARTSTAAISAQAYLEQKANKEARERDRERSREDRQYSRSRSRSRSASSIRTSLSKQLPNMIPSEPTPGEPTNISTDLDASSSRGRPIVPSEERRLRVVSPPRKRIEKNPVKGILRQPREKFPEDPTPIREGVFPLKDAKKDGIPADARWTKISRKLVNPEALEAGKERYEARENFVVVLRVLTREEVQGYAEVTQKIRAAREEIEDQEREERRRARRERHERHKRERDEHYKETLVINEPRRRPGRDREVSDSEESVYEGDRVPDKYEGHRVADRERVKKAAGPTAEESAYEADRDTDMERVRRDAGPVA